MLNNGELTTKTTSIQTEIGQTIGGWSFDSNNTQAVIIVNANVGNYYTPAVLQTINILSIQQVSLILFPTFRIKSIFLNQA